MKCVIIDAIEEVNELSAILNKYDNSGDLDPDTFIRDCSIAAAINFDLVKVEDKHRTFKQDDFDAQMERIKTSLMDLGFEDESYEVVKVGIISFIADLTDMMILTIADQSYTLCFGKIRDDLSILFNMSKVEGDQDGKDSSGERVPT